MNALAKAFEFFSWRYTCTAVNFTGTKASEMPRVDFKWSSNRDGRWWAWEVLAAGQLAIAGAAEEPS